MVQKTFGIYADSSEECNLMIQIGKQHLACWTVLSNTSTVHSFEYFQTDSFIEENFKELFRQIKLHSKLLEQSAPPTIIWNNDECLILPKHFINTHQEHLLCTAYGNKDIYLPFYQQEQESNILFRISEEAFKEINHYFPKAVIHHRYTSILQTQPSSKDILEVFCYPEIVTIKVTNKNNLLSIQNYCYQTAEDVLYWLLNICTQWQIEVINVTIVLSGLIDEESSLYKEIYKYFPDITFSKNNVSFVEAEKFSDYPTHYFLPFFNPVA